MLGKIEVIEEVFNVPIDVDYNNKGDDVVTLGIESDYRWGNKLDGYRVVTDQHEFLVLIANEQSCCESWGYFSSDDDLTDYIGAELNKVQLTDSLLKKRDLSFNEGTEEWDEAWAIRSAMQDDTIQFVDFVTDRGPFQLAVYNAHNGYYGHRIVVGVDQKVIKTGYL